MELTWYAGTFIVAFVGCIMWDLVYGPLRPQLCRKFHGWLARRDAKKELRRRLKALSHIVENDGEWLKAREVWYPLLEEVQGAWQRNTRPKNSGYNLAETDWGTEPDPYHDRNDKIRRDDVGPNGGSE